MTKRSLMWFRRDLRLGDHPAVLAAADGDAEVLGVFVADDALLRPSGAPRRVFLAGALEALSQQLGGRLLVVHGEPETVIPRLASAIQADAVHCSADYMPYGRQRDQRVEKALNDRGIALIATGSPYAVAPGRVTKPDGTPYAVYTPFSRGWADHGWRAPAGPADHVRWSDATSQDEPDRVEPASLAAPLDDDIAAKLPEPGEQAALETWRRFAENALDDYDGDRNMPDRPGTSRMSVYLKYGCIHPRTLLADLRPRRSKGAGTYGRELAWREFYADVVFHHPESIRKSIDPAIDGMQWDSGPEADARFEAWQQGRTGYPYIDAAMRQLLTEGWMHNRARMGTASFLIKDLHLPWQWGARHFMRHLVDGDVASNNHGWQWVAGSGAQAAPFYRIFNPITQGEKFDPKGEYVRTYVRELGEIPGKAVHQPWQFADGPPSNYPKPIVDHAAERVEALRRFEQRPRVR